MPPRIPSSCPAGSKSYTVVAGDRMYLIAQKFGVKLSDLINANPHIPDPNVIFPGDVLCIPGQVPGPLKLPCSVLLTPKPQVPSGVISNAVGYIGSTGNHTISIISNLPAPTIFGNYASYSAYIVFTGHTMSKPLYSTTETTPSWASTIDLGTETITPGVQIIVSANQGTISPPPGDHVLFEGSFSC